VTNVPRRRYRRQAVSGLSGLRLPHYAAPESEDKTVPNIAVFSIVVLASLGFVEKGNRSSANLCETLSELGYSFFVEHSPRVPDDKVYLIRQVPIW
jgi:hypothetical protein